MIWTESFSLALRMTRIHECARIIELNIDDAIYPILQMRPYLYIIYSPLGIYADVSERYIPLASTATSRDDYLELAISQQRGTFTPHVSAISREPFRASSRDSPLTLSARATVNRGTKFRGVRAVRKRYSSELSSSTDARGMHVDVMRG